MPRTVISRSGAALGLAWLGCLILLLGAAAQTASSPEASPDASPGASPTANGGSISIQRFVCNAEDAPRIDIFEPDAAPVVDDLDANMCVPAPGLFHLLSDGGRTVQSFQTEPDGTLTIEGLEPTEPGTDGYRLVDSDSTGNGYITVAPGQTTAAVSYDYEFVFIMPTQPTIPTINIPEEPPPPPTIIAGAGTGEDDPDDEAFDFGSDSGVSDEGNDAADSTFVDETGASEPVVDSDKRSRQVAFLLLAVAGYAGFLIWKKRSRAKAAKR